MEAFQALLKSQEEELSELPGWIKDSYWREAKAVIDRLEELNFLKFIRGEICV